MKINKLGKDSGEKKMMMKMKKLRRRRLVEDVQEKMRVKIKVLLRKELMRQGCLQSKIYRESIDRWV